jgi:hypothetical protein
MDWRSEVMKFQILVALVITILTLIGFFTLPSLYLLTLGVFGLGCVALALVFALIIEKVERA